MNSTNDIIADMLTRLRNASQVKQKTVSIPKSKMTLRIAQILCNEGFIGSVENSSTNEDNSNSQYFFTVSLKYFGKQLKPAFLNMERISKPGRRIYTNSKSIPEVLGGVGIALLSTPQGILSDKNARKNKVGGEVLCFIY
jgi:small subunit ribosomal protein S8